MTPRSARILGSLAVLVWAGVLLYFHASGRINKYLAPDFRLIAFVGGLGLAVLGGFNLLTAGQAAGCGHDHGHDHDHGSCGGHDSGSGDLHPLVAFVLMVLPVGLAVAWAGPDSYSAKALARKGLYDSPASIASFLPEAPPLTREEMEETHRKTADGHHVFNLMELHYATGDREMQSVIEGMKVETEGRWVEEKARNPHGTRMRLYRLFITCCAADSRAVPIVLEFGKVPPELPENGWVKVAGTMRFLLEGGVLQPVLMVDRAETAEPPFEESFFRY